MVVICLPETEPTRVMHERCMYSALGAPALRDAVSSERAKVFSPSFLTAYESGRWGTDFALFAEAFKKNRIAPYPQSAPLKIYQGDADDIVPVDAMTANCSAITKPAPITDHSPIETLSLIVAPAPI